MNHSRGTPRPLSRPAAGVVALGLLALLVPLVTSTVSPAGALPAPSGRVVTPLRPDPNDDGRAVVMEPDGRMLVVGSAGGDFAVLRENPDLSTQRDFSDDQQATTDFGANDDVANAVAVDAGDRVVAAGSSAGNVAIARYDTRGHLDRSFGRRGLVTTDLGAGDDAAHGVAITGDGAVVVAAGSNQSGLLLRYRPDGSLDPDFGAGGRAPIAGAGRPRALVAQPDGKLVVVAARGTEFLVARFAADGGPDASFGSGGQVRLSASAASSAHALALWADGRITAVGSRGGDALVVRLLASGEPDPAFGVGGTVMIDRGATEAASGVAVSPEGRTLVAGAAGASGFIAGLLPDGGSDSTWGTAGAVATPVPLRSVALGTNRNVYTIGPGQGDIWFNVYNHTGNDPNQRPESIDFGHPRGQVQRGIRLADGKVLVLAEVSGTIELLRYNPDASLDSSFGRDGRVFSDLASWPAGISVDPGGRIAVAGRRDGDAAVVVFEADGDLDASFGDDGRVLVDFGSDFEEATSVLALPDGRLVMTGGDPDGSVLARLTPAGGLDPTFGDAGKIKNGANYPGRSATVVRQPDGKLLLTGPGIAVSRLEANGSLDTGFGNGGTVDLASSGGFSRMPFSVVLQPGGGILVGGGRFWPNGSQFSVARLAADGTPDEDWPEVQSSPNTIPSTEQGVLNDIILLPDGRVLSVGGQAATRRSASGRFDLEFGRNGVHRLEADGGEVVDAFLLGDGTVQTVGTQDRQVVVARNRIPLAGLSSPRGWGWSQFGQAAPGTSPNRLTPGLVPGLTNVVDVAGGGAHSLALRSDGTVWAWGWNGFGQLGDGTIAERPTPVQVAGLDRVAHIAAGAYHSLAVRDDGSVWAWGWNGMGQLGDGTTVDRHLPVRAAVNSIHSETQIAAGAYHSLALIGGSSPVAWGWNGFGQLGDGTNVERHIPVPVLEPVNTPILRPTSIAAGAFHSLVSTGEGYVWGWGWNGFGQLGDGTTVDRWRAVYTTVPGAVSVSGGGAHSLALSADGTLRAWGWNGLGQLGDGTRTNRLTPVTVPAFGDVAKVQSGWYHNLALRRDGTVWAWGWNGHGQLGDGTTLDAVRPVLPAGMSGASTVAGGGVHSVGV